MLNEESSGFGTILSGKKSLAVSDNAKPFVSIIILNFNGKSYLKDCFSSLQTIDYPTSKFEVIFVDNGSIDGSAEYVQEEFPWVSIIRLNKNIGFGGGNNQGVRFVKGDYVIFLNNDTKVTQKWLSELVQSAIGFSVPICSSKTLLMEKPDIIDYGGGKFTLNGRGYSISFGKENNCSTACSLTGYPCAASMLIKKQVFADLYGFDEDYFACLDDTDLGWRAWLFGYRVLYCPTSVVYHEAGGTSGKGRLSPMKAFHGTKDSFLTVLKNLEWQNVPFGVFLDLSYDLVEFFLLLKNRDLECIRSKIQAYSWLFKNLGRILQKRTLVQGKRVISDKWLTKMRFLTTLNEAWQEYQRLSKLFPQT